MIEYSRSHTQSDRALSRRGADDCAPSPKCHTTTLGNQTNRFSHHDFSRARRFGCALLMRNYSHVFMCTSEVRRLLVSGVRTLKAHNCSFSAVVVAAAGAQKMRQIWQTNRSTTMMMDAPSDAAASSGFEMMSAAPPRR